MERRRIGILGYDGVTAINVIGPLEAFALAGRESNGTAPAYEVFPISLGRGGFVTDTGLHMHTQVSAEDEVRLDTLVVPGGVTIRQEQIADRVAECVAHHGRDSRRVVSICTGIYGVAATGFLDDREVTTHWRYSRDVAKRFPKLRMNDRALFLRDGKYYTSGGATAGIDLALALIEEDCGNDVALNVARNLLVYRRREGGQEQYSEPRRIGFRSRPDQLQRLAVWVEQHLDQRLRLDVLADRLAVSYNELVVRFKKTFGVTPGAFIKGLRMEEARRRLSRGATVASVAKFSGFCSKGYFTQEFRWRFGITPEDYRTRFGPAWPSFARDVDTPTGGNQNSDTSPIRDAQFAPALVGTAAHDMPQFV
jgi:transcriptional regulator GlxA family with amidase domain